MLACTILNNIFALFLPSVMADIVNIGIEKKGVVDVNLLTGLETQTDVVARQTSYILNKGLIMLAVTLVIVFFTIVSAYFSSKLSSGISLDMRKDLFSKIMSIPYDKFDEFSASSLITRILEDVESVKGLILMATNILMPPLMIIGGIIMSAKTNLKLSAVVFLGTLIAVAIIFIYFKIVTPKSQTFIDLVDKFNMVVMQRLSGTVIIRMFGNKNFEQKKFENSNHELTETSIFINRVAAILMPVLTAVVNFITVFVLWYSSVKISIFEMNIGDIMAFLQYSAMVISAFLILSILVGSVPRILTSVSRIGEILDLKSVSENLQDNQIILEEPIKTIEFKNVGFKYPDAKQYVLKNINLKINAGEKIGIIGTIGSGKTTFLKLLFGFYKPTNGEILINGIDLSKINHQEFIKKISYSEQSGILFSGDVTSNLKFGNENASEEDLWHALKIAQIYDFVKEKGLDFKISQSGENLSGGQRQRLALARSLVKKAEIYIFDDSFSKLDFKTELNLREELKQELIGRTAVVVSQRISTIKDTDKILVFNNASLEGFGTHEELSKSCFIYSELLKFQSLSKEAT